MSELSCAATVNPPEAVRIGTVGKALDGVELRLADDGELLVRGPLVMKGYRNDPEKTAEAIDADGWLHTGDIATIDDDGYVRIVDRKKELIVNAAGKNMSPANIEGTIKVELPARRLRGGHRRRPAVRRRADHPRSRCGAAFAASHGLADRSPAALAARSGGARGGRRRASPRRTPACRAWSRSRSSRSCPRSGSPAATRSPRR